MGGSRSTEAASTGEVPAVTSRVTTFREPAVPFGVETVALRVSRGTRGSFESERSSRAKSFPLEAVFWLRIRMQADVEVPVLKVP